MIANLPKLEVGDLLEFTSEEYVYSLGDEYYIDEKANKIYLDEDDFDGHKINHISAVFRRIDCYTYKCIWEANWRVVDNQPTHQHEDKGE